MVRAICGEKKIDYLSGPINGGQLLIEAYEHAKNLRTPPSEDYWACNVKNKNIDNLRANAETIRKTKKITLINPGEFQVTTEGWGQEEYMDLWESIISKFVKRVWFADGWEYSYGCVREYVFSTNLKVQTVDLKGQAICVDSAQVKINESLSTLNRSVESGHSQSERMTRLIEQLIEERDKLNV